MNFSFTCSFLKLTLHVSIWTFFFFSLQQPEGQQANCGESCFPANAQDAIALKTAILHELFTGEVKDGSERTDNRGHFWRKVCMVFITW